MNTDELHTVVEYALKDSSENLMLSKKEDMIYHASVTVITPKGNNFVLPWTSLLKSSDYYGHNSELVKTDNSEILRSQWTLQVNNQPVSEILDNSLRIE